MQPTTNVFLCLPQRDYNLYINVTKTNKHMFPMWFVWVMFDTFIIIKKNTNII